MVANIIRKDCGALEIGIVDLFLRVTFGSSGAPTIDPTISKGFKSIVRNSAGDYTITLQDSWQKLLKVNRTCDTSGISGVAPTAPAFWIKAQSVNSANGTVRIVCNSAGTATDPASGEACLIHIIAKNSLV